MGKQRKANLFNILPTEYYFIASFLLSPLVIMWIWKLIEITRPNSPMVDSFFNNLSVEALGSFLGGLIAVAIFVLELRRNEQEKTNNNNKKAEDQIKYCQYLLKNGIELVKTQRNLFDQYTKQIEMNPLVIPKTIFDPGQSFNRLNYLFNDLSFFHNYIEIFKTTSTNIETYKKIEDCIDYFSNVQKQVVGMHTEAIDNYKNRVFRAQDLIRSTNDLLLRLMTDYYSRDYYYSMFLWIQLRKLRALFKLDPHDIGAVVNHLIKIKNISMANFLYIPESKLVVERIAEISILKIEMQENILTHKNEFEIVIYYFDLMLEKLNKNANNIIQFNQ